MPSARQASATRRRIPRQTRAADTVATILEAAAQILEAGSLAAFTTNAVAERAGVSIGTLYQYFANKNLVLLALAQQEMKRGLADVARALQDGSAPGVEGRVRAGISADFAALTRRVLSGELEAAVPAMLCSEVHSSRVFQRALTVARARPRRGYSS
jgi:AcrR family transcriptional regulator